MAIAAVTVSLTACGGKNDAKEGGEEGGNSPYGPVKVEERTAVLPATAGGDAPELFTLVNEKGEATVTVTGTPNGEDGGDITIKATLNYDIPALSGDTYSGFASSPVLTVHFVDANGKDVGGWCEFRMNENDEAAIEKIVKEDGAKGAKGSIEVTYSDFKYGEEYNSIFDNAKGVSLKTNKLRKASEKKTSSTTTSSAPTGNAADDNGIYETEENEDNIDLESVQWISRYDSDDDDTTPGTGVYKHKTKTGYWLCFGNPNGPDGSSYYIRGKENYMTTYKGHDVSGYDYYLDYKGKYDSKPARYFFNKK